MKFIKRLLNKLKGSKIQNRKVTKARFLYLYIIIGSISGLLYFIAAIFLDYPKFLALTPLYLLLAFIAYKFLAKNWRSMWLFIIDTEQGRLLLFLNEHTHFEEEHKLKLIKWVYLRRRTIRKETYNVLIKKVMDKEELTKEERKMLKYKSVFCPQQLREGFNEAVLVNALIFAHENIQVLDDELRRIMSLSDTNVLAFDLNTEYEKVKNSKYNKLIETGKKADKRMKVNEKLKSPKK